MVPAAIVIAGLLAGSLLFLWRRPASLRFSATPLPEGRHPVGSTILFLHDGRRDRDLAVQVWYPRARGDCPSPAPYFPFGRPPHESGEALATRSCLDAPPEPGPWPAVIFSPGWDGGSHQNTGLCESLASEGFVVFGINHPGAAPLIVWPDGRRITNGGLEKFDLSGDRPAAGFERAAEREVAARTDDVRFILDALPALDAGSLGDGKLAGLLHADRAGVAGFSFGGAVAAEVSRLDSRAVAGVNLDGRLFGASRREATVRPFLMITDNLPPPAQSELESADPAARRQAQFLAQGYREFGLWERAPNVTIIRIDGISHEDFTDSALLRGPASSEWFLRINRAVSDFFLRHLGRGPT